MKRTITEEKPTLPYNPFSDGARLPRFILKPGCEHYNDCETCPFEECMVGKKLKGGKDGSPQMHEM